MKIALVHELLTMRGGAERVLRSVAAMFPEAPISTFLYDERKLGAWFPPERVRTSRLQKFAALSTNHHLYLRRFPKAIEAFDCTGMDLVLSFSSAFAHGIRTRGLTKHLCYVHSPARYLWDRTHDVLEHAGRGFLGPLRRRYLERTFHRLREWDVLAADRPDMLLAPSRAVQRRIELYWRRESTVLHPPVDLAVFALQSHPRSADAPYIIASTLVPYKRIELAIATCNLLKKPLIVIGEGSARRGLEQIAGPTVAFLGYCPHAELVGYLQGARGFLFPGDEDFGLAPIEAMACGTPVIAFRGGGVLETVLEGETGEFFTEPTVKSLLGAIEIFEQKKYSPEACRMQAETFSPLRFEEGLRRAIDAVMHG